jgi:AhpD family alkylhydroperoxidase
MNIIPGTARKLRLWSLAVSAVNNCEIITAHEKVLRERSSPASKSTAVPAIAAAARSRDAGNRPATSVSLPLAA